MPHKCPSLRRGDTPVQHMQKLCAPRWAQESSRRAPVDPELGLLCATTTTSPKSPRQSGSDAWRCAPAFVRRRPSMMRGVVHSKAPAGDRGRRPSPEPTERLHTMPNWRATPGWRAAPPALNASRTSGCVVSGRLRPSATAFKQRRRGLVRLASPAPARRMSIGVQVNASGIVCPKPALSGTNAPCEATRLHEKRSGCMPAR